MAAISKGGFLSLFSFGVSAPKQTKNTHKLAERAYKATNGPTDELRNVYRAYLDNKARSTKHKTS